MPRRLIHAAILICLVVGLMAGGGCARVASAAGPTTTEEVVEAFRRARLEVGASRPMTDEELRDVPPPIDGTNYGTVPLPIEGTRFAMPSFPPDVAGRVLRFGTSPEAWSAREFYGMLGKLSGRSEYRYHVFVRDRFVVLLTRDLPYDEAVAFEKVLNGAGAAAKPAATPAAASPAAPESAASAIGGSGIAFGKPNILTAHRPSNPFFNLEYLLGLRKDAPGGQYAVEVAVLATNTTDRVMSFDVKVTLQTPSGAVAALGPSVLELMPGRSRPVLHHFDPSVPAAYGSVTVEVVRVIRESATTPGAEAARKIAFGATNVTPAPGGAVQPPYLRWEPRVGEASVEVTNEGSTSRWATVWLALLKGDELLGVAGCYGRFPAGETKTATLWTMRGAVSGYDRTYLDVEMDQNQGSLGGVDCSGVNDYIAAAKGGYAGEAGDVMADEGETGSAQVVDGFREAGLEVGVSRPLTRDELEADSRLGDTSFGVKLPFPSEGTRFSIPSLGEDVGGRVLRYDVQDYVASAVRYYSARTDQAASDRDRVRVYAKGCIILLLDWNVPETQAAAYEKAFLGIERESPMPKTDSTSEGKG